MEKIVLRMFNTAALVFVFASFVSAQSLVSGLTDTNVVVSVLEKEGRRIADVPLKFKDVPSSLAGKTLVIVSRGDRQAAGQGFQFTVTKEAVVYLFVMERGKPNVPAEWKKTVLNATFYYDKTMDFKDSIYTKKIAAGEKVIVPAHDGSDGSSFGVPHCCVVVPNE
ncbi:MAG: hypothetical protein AABZ39_04230 [Spirochaetota bacterium]